MGWRSSWGGGTRERGWWVLSCERVAEVGAAAARGAAVAVAVAAAAAVAVAAAGVGEA
jgi:hypothetical protein